MKKNSPAYVLGFMVVVSAVCGAAVSFVHFAMKDTLDANTQLARNRTIARAFTLVVEQDRAESYTTALREQVTADTILYEGRSWQRFTRASPPHDIGFIFSGMGFWDAIIGIIVLSSDLSTIRALDIIEQKETPGLGARIEEDLFKGQFSGYSTDWDNASGKPVNFGAEGEADKGQRIDAITGATQTSLSLEKIINNELAAFRRALHHTTPHQKER
jgi:Na+-transporting NADH:ubiquinone oxidoreductase subunit C